MTKYCPKLVILFLFRQFLGYSNWNKPGTWNFTNITIFEDQIFIIFE